LQNLNQFQKNLVFWNQHEKFYLLMKFEENLRWWVDWLRQWTENDPCRVATKLKKYLNNINACWFLLLVQCAQTVLKLKKGIK